MNNPETNPISLFFKTISQHYVGVVALALVGSACYLWLAEKPVPNTLENFTLIVVSFLFGSQKSKSSEDAK